MRLNKWIALILSVTTIISLHAAYSGTLESKSNKPLAVLTTYDSFSMLVSSQAAAIKAVNMIDKMTELAKKAAMGTTNTTNRYYLDQEYQITLTELNNILTSNVFDGLYLFGTHLKIDMNDKHIDKVLHHLDLDYLKINGLSVLTMQDASAAENRISTAIDFVNRWLASKEAHMKSTIAKNTSVVDYSSASTLTINSAVSAQNLLNSLQDYQSRLLKILGEIKDITLKAMDGRTTDSERRHLDVEFQQNLTMISNMAWTSMFTNIHVFNGGNMDLRLADKQIHINLPELNTTEIGLKNSNIITIQNAVEMYQKLRMVKDQLSYWIAIGEFVQDAHRPIKETLS